MRNSLIKVKDNYSYKDVDQKLLKKLEKKFQDTIVKHLVENVAYKIRDGVSEICLDYDIVAVYIPNYTEEAPEGAEHWEYINEFEKGIMLTNHEELEKAVSFPKENGIFLSTQEYSKRLGMAFMRCIMGHILYGKSAGFSKTINTAMFE